MTVLFLCVLDKVESSFHIIYLVNIDCIHVKHKRFGMSEIISKKYDSSCFFLISEYFFQFGFVCTSVNNVIIVYVSVYKGKTTIFLDYWFNKNLDWCKIPRLLDNLFSIRFIWFFHVRFVCCQLKVWSLLFFMWSFWCAKQ